MSAAITMVAIEREHGNAAQMVDWMPEGMPMQMYSELFKGWSWYQVQTGGHIFLGVLPDSHPSNQDGANHCSDWDK